MLTSQEEIRGCSSGSILTLRDLPPSYSVQDDNWAVCFTRSTEKGIKALVLVTGKEVFLGGGSSTDCLY